MQQPAPEHAGARRAACVLVPVLTLLVPLGCEEPETGVPPPVIPEELVQLWQPTSTRVELDVHSFWSGPSGFRAGRSELSAAQLEALEAVRGVRRKPETRVDTDSFALRIWDVDGTLARYSTDPVGGGVPLIIDWESFSPFLETLRCLSARAGRVGPSPVPDAGPSTSPAFSAAEAPPMSTADPGCLHGVRGGGLVFGIVDIWRQVAVEAAGTYRILASGCLGPTELRLFSSDAQTEIAAAFGDEGSCPVMTREFLDPGLYPMLIHSESTRDDADFFMRVLPAGIDAGSP